MSINKFEEFARPGERILAVVGVISPSYMGAVVISPISRTVETIEEGLGFGRAISMEFEKQTHTVCLQGNEVIARENFGHLVDEGGYWGQPKIVYKAILTPPK